MVTSVPGVRAIEPGLGTTMRTLDAHVRRSGARTAQFGLYIDTADGTAVVEVALDGSRTVRETVRDTQLALRAALGEDVEGGEPEVTVRVQSLQV